MTGGAGRDDGPQAKDAAGGMPVDEPGATAVIPVDEQATEVILPARAPAPVAEAAPTRLDRPAAPMAAGRRPRARAARAWTIVLVALATLVALAAVTDMVLRNEAEARFAEQVEQNLPDGVEGDVTVSLGGFSVIAQYLSGSMDRVELSAPELSVDGVPIAVDVVGEGVPVDLSAAVDHLTATLEADPAAVNRLVDVPGVEGDLTLGDGTVGYTETVRILGFPVEYTVTAQPTAAGDTVLLEPVGAEIAAGGGSIDVSGLADAILGDDPVPVCVAEHLPQGVEVQQITVEPDRATVTLEASGLRLDAASLATTGSCS